MQFSNRTLLAATGSMTSARMNHTGTLLQNGKVLVAGGQGSIAGKNFELYNPVTGKFDYEGIMSVEHLYHAATLLSNGNLLVTGGAG
ncbi:MAG: kelch repeat-containing protein, partial [Deltaproteobacteria bacterium]